MKRKILSIVVGVTLIGTTIAFSDVDQTEAITKRDQAEKVEMFLAKGLDEAKTNGEKWISEVDNNKEIYAQITLNNKRTVKEIRDLTKDHNLEVKGWSYMINIGNHTAVGGYTISPNESMIEAEKRFNHSLKTVIKRQIDILKKEEKKDDITTDIRNSAIAKRQSLQTKLRELSNNDARIVYGIKVKGKAGTLYNLLDKKQIHALKKSTKQDDESTALYKSIPENWLEGAVK